MRLFSRRNIDGLPLLPLNQKAENVECRRETGGSAVGIGS
jgi:hypothetical protein